MKFLVRSVYILMFSCTLLKANRIEFEISHPDRLLMVVAGTEVNDYRASENLNLLLKALYIKMDFGNFDYAIVHRILVVNENSCMVYYMGERNNKTSKDSKEFFCAHGRYLHKSRISDKIPQDALKWQIRPLDEVQYEKLSNSLNLILKTPLALPDKFEGAMSDVPICIIRNYTLGQWAIRDPINNSRVAYAQFGELLTEMSKTIKD